MQYTEGAVAGGYWIECECGWLSKYHQTLARRRKARERHEQDHVEEKIWYVVHADGTVAKPSFPTKREALWSVGVKTSTKLSPGRYAAAGGVIVTTKTRVLLPA